MTVCQRESVAVQLGVGAAKLLQGSSQIKKLNLSGANLGDEGAQLLSAMLTSCVHTALQELELSDCGIGRSGVSRIFQVLQGFAAPALEVCLQVHRLSSRRCHCPPVPNCR